MEEAACSITEMHADCHTIQHRCRFIQDGIGVLTL